MSKKVSDVGYVSVMTGDDCILGVFGGALHQMPIDLFRTNLNMNDEQVLNDLAYYIDVNSPSPLGSTRVDVGGNLNMRFVMEQMEEDVLMDSHGNYCVLNPNDNRYTDDGDAVVDMASNEILSKWSNCDMMHHVPQSYGRIQTVQVGSSTRLRLWLSPAPLPGGYVIPELFYGKFKAVVVNNVLRSLPNKVPTASRTINQFFDYAQARSKDHGLTNLDVRNHLLFHMMGKYGWRDSQNCKSSDGTLIWGVGLDGTESTGSDKFANQKNITTGKTLRLGKNDGKVTTTDSDGTQVHCVNVGGTENPWGQYWEMIQGLCSVGTDVYCWRSNFMPTGTPTASSFANAPHVVLQRPTTGKWGMNIIASESGQGCYMIPKEAASGISYGDYYSYSDNGQLWLFGGGSNSGSACGLASATSHDVWSYSSADVAARLAFFGEGTKINSRRLAEIVA